MYGCMYVYMDGCIHGWMYTWMDVYMNGSIHGWMYTWMDVYMDGWMYGCVYVYMDGCIHGWMYTWMDVYMDGWMYGCVYVYIYIYLYPMCIKISPRFVQHHLSEWGGSRYFKYKKVGSIPRHPGKKKELTWATFWMISYKMTLCTCDCRGVKVWIKNKFQPPEPRFCTGNSHFVLGPSEDRKLLLCERSPNPQIFDNKMARVRCMTWGRRVVF